MHKVALLRPLAPSVSNTRVSHYILSLAIIGITALLCTPFSSPSAYHVTSFILLFVVALLSMFLGVGPILLASTVASLVWNYFFIPPSHTFLIDKAEDILMFCMFFIVALVNGVLTSKVRSQQRLTREREERTNSLFELTRELSKATGIEDVLKVAEAKIRRHFSIESRFILQDASNNLVFNNSDKNILHMDKKDREVAVWSFTTSQKAGKFTDNTHARNFTFYPLKGKKLNPGVVVIKLEKPLYKDTGTLWNTFLALISNALEREFLAVLARKAKLLDESDKLYKTLFNSISHELRIPVATIAAASDSLITTVHPHEVRSALCHEIYTASLRLNRLIENLLNMARLESGRISPRPDWYEINDLINKVLDDLRDELLPFGVDVRLPEDLPFVKIDFGLMEQVLFNLLLNACQHAPPGSVVTIQIEHVENNLIIRIMDRGPGFTQAMLDNLFAKFYKTDSSKTGGLGLGLSIVRGFVEAHRGVVSVANREGGGATFTIVIPSGQTGKQIDRPTYHEAH